MTKNTASKKSRRLLKSKPKPEMPLTPLMQDTQNRLSALDTVLSPFWSVRCGR